MPTREDLQYFRSAIIGGFRDQFFTTANGTWRIDYGDDDFGYYAILQCEPPAGFSYVGKDGTIGDFRGFLLYYQKV